MDFDDFSVIWVSDLSFSLFSLCLSDLGFYIPGSDSFPGEYCGNDGLQIDPVQPDWWLWSRKDVENEQTCTKKEEEPNCFCCWGMQNLLATSAWCVFCFCFLILISFWKICYQDALRAADFKEYSPQTRESLSCWNPDCIGFNLIEYLLCKICENERPGAILVFMTGWDDISSLKDKLQAHPFLGDPSRVLLLACHGSMASSEQVSL